MTSTIRMSGAEPRSARRPHPFHGWRIVGYAGVVLAMTAPGQTAAVSVFIDPLIADLGLSRSVVSTGYLIGTLTGAAALLTGTSLPAAVAVAAALTSLPAGCQRQGSHSPGEQTSRRRLAAGSG